MPGSCFEVDMCTKPSFSSAEMFTFSDPSVYQTAKCFATYGTMSHPDAKQLPSKGKPWSTLLGLDFVHRVSLSATSHDIRVPSVGC